MKYGYFTNYRKAKTKDPFHYYGDLARGLLIVASIAMILSVSPFNDSLPQSFAISILAAVIFALLLELFSTNQNFVTITNLFAAGGLFIAIEFYISTQGYALSDPMFIKLQFLSLLFFLAAYFNAMAFTFRLKSYIIKI